MEQCDRNGIQKPFNIVFDTYNHQLNTAGDRFVMDKAILLMPNKTGSKAISLKKVMQNKHRLRKDPHHFINATRNIQALSGGQIRTVNIWLIASFNGLEVIWNRHG